MKKLIYLVCMGVFIMSCNKENKIENRFRDFLTKIPEIQLPFTANSNEALSSKVEISDTLYKDFFADAQGILGKIKINDTITGVLYLYGGNEIYPALKTYDNTGRLVAEQQLLTLMGGNGVDDSGGSSYVNLNKDFHISITDTIRSVEKDSLGIAIDSTWQVDVIHYNYAINPNGKIETKEIIQKAVAAE